MDFFRKNEDKTSDVGFMEWLGKSIVGLVRSFASWVAGWDVWKWLGKAWDWIANWSKKLGHAIKSFVVECKNKFINWWNKFIDKLIDCGKFSFFGMDVDLFAGADSMKIGIESGPNPPHYQTMEDDEAVIVDDGPAVIEQIKHERDDQLKENVQQYKEQVDDKIKADNRKHAADVKASAAEVDAELDAFLEEASRRPDVKTPPVPVKTRSAGMSLEEQEG